MNEFPFTDADLTAAAFAVSESMLASLPKPDEIEHTFSDGFLKKMDALIAKDRRRQRVRSIARRAAIIALAVLVTLGTWLAVDTEARAALVRWVRTVHEKWTEYRFAPMENHGILPVYTLTRLPEGYALLSDTEGTDGHTVLYEDADTGERLSFFYGFWNPETTPPIFSDDNSPHRSVSIDRVNERTGVVGLFYPDYGPDAQNVVTWSERINSGTGKGEHICFYLKGQLSEEELLYLAGRVAYSNDLPAYELNWLPEGYAEAPEITWKPRHISYYEHVTGGDRFTFTYFLMDDTISGQITEYDSVESVTVRGRPADYYAGNSVSAENSLIWMDEEQGLFFSLSGALEKETLLHVAENTALSTTLLPAYRLFWIPEGQRLYREEENKTRYDALYNDEHGTSIHFFYYHLAAGEHRLFPRRPAVIPERIHVREWNAEFYPATNPEERSLLVWIDEETNLAFYLYSNVDKEDTIRMAYHISLQRGN